MSKSEVIVTITVEATNTMKYERVSLGTRVLTFEPTGKPMRHILNIGNDVGVSEEMNPVFLDSIEIQPRMVEQVRK